MPRQQSGGAQHTAADEIIRHYSKLFSAHACSVPNLLNVGTLIDAILLFLLIAHGHGSMMPLWRRTNGGMAKPVLNLHLHVDSWVAVAGLQLQQRTDGRQGGLHLVHALPSSTWDDAHNGRVISKQHAARSKGAARHL